MTARGQDVLLGSMLGLMVGALPGLLAAGAFVTWRLGGDLGQLELATYLRLLPGAGALANWPFRTRALIGLGVAFASAMAGVVLCWREELSSHGTARWAGSRELRRAGLLARRLREARGPIWGKLGSPRSRAHAATNRSGHDQAMYYRNYRLWGGDAARDGCGG